MSHCGLYLSKICTKLDQNKIKFEIINPNENFTNKYNKYNQLIIRLTQIISNRQNTAINCITEREKQILAQLIFNLQSLNIPKILLYLQPYFKENVYTYLWILKEIKKNFNSKIICCGTYFWTDPIKILKKYSFIDYILDYYFTDAVTEIINGVDARKIKSITYRTNTKILKNKKGIIDLNNEPIPNNFLSFKHPKIIPIEYSVGCPFYCFFCDNKKSAPRFQIKNVNILIKEIKFNYKNGVKYFFICGSAINFVEDHLRNFCNALIKNNLNCKWSSVLIPSKLKKSTFELMNKAGCIHLSMGIETADQNILKAFNKNVTLESAEIILQSSSEANIKNTLTFMVGLPMEKKYENIKKKEFIKRNKRYINSIAIFPFQIRRGALMLKMAHKFGIKLRNNSNNDNRYLKFDEVCGLTWEEIYQKQQSLMYELNIFLKENRIPSTSPGEYFIKLLKLSSER
jgi:radical SAM superfamily enzyme YgiQ (UPF0313 family)